VSLTVVTVCVVVAAASLVLPVTLSYDSWAWLTWGREVGALALDTNQGPSWKPLPVVVTTLLSPLGSLAVPLWLVIARAAGLLALVAAYRLAARFAGWVAGVVAAILLLVAPDGDPRFPRLVLEGHTAPVTAALALWAVDRHLAGRRATAFWLVVLLALDRPEAWPFLGAYAWWLWRRDPELRRAVAAGVSLVPLLWFGGDWWGSGSPLHGARSARVAARDGARTTDALIRVADVVAVPAWVLAGFGVFDARRRGERSLLLVALLAIAWFAVVVIMSALFGYAALTRFLLPGAALVCVLAGVGLVRAFEAMTTGRSRAVLVAVVLVVALPLVLVRAVGVGEVFDEMRTRDGTVSELDDVIHRAGGRDVVVACGSVSIDDPGVARRALAWKLDAPVGTIGRRVRDRRGVVFATLGGPVQRRWDRAGRAELLASSRTWAVYGSACRRPGG
jgi:hypothetical protein